MRLLVAEDDEKLRDVLTRGLIQAGYAVDAVSDGEDAHASLMRDAYDVAVIDWRMPGRDGLDVVATLRAGGSSLPVLMLTARDTPPDRIRGLDAGCDDYLVKPFDFDELLARLRALLRRPAATLGLQLRVGALRIDPATGSASVNGGSIALTPTEFAIVELLARRSPAVVHRDAIANHAWPDSLDAIGSNNIDVHIARIRAKVVDAGVRIQAVRRVGYRLVER
jgi:DNA-binding response OmpR family regulator